MAGDADFSKVSLLLHMDGANGSTTFTDSSPGSKIVTAYGGARISTAQSKFGGSTGYFDGAGDALSVAASTDLDFGTGDFTIELWARQGSAAGIQCLVVRQQDVYSQGLFQLRLNAGKPEFIFCANGSWSVVTLSAAQAIAQSEWVHIAASRQSGAARLFAAGALVASGSASGALDVGSKPLSVGCLDASSSTNLSAFFSGHIDDVRITKGAARYTANFTPPTEPFPNASVAYALSGTVTDASNSPAARLIRAYREDTGALAGSATSNAVSGAYSIVVDTGGAHTLNAYPAAGESLPTLTLRGVLPA